jgi:hypothetical protein
MDRRYDWFISYKSEDVHKVRPIAEQLVASGRNVWFAEHEVLLANRERFQEAIANGAHRSDRGLCFTNKLYEGSEYTMYELNLLLKTCGCRNILAVRLGEALVLDRLLSGSPSINYAGSESILDEVEKRDRLGHIRSIPSQSGPSGQTFFSYRDTEYSLVLSGWALLRDGKKAAWPWGGAGPWLQTCIDGIQINGNIQVGPQDVGRRKVRARKIVGIIDDREYYNNIVLFAEKYFGRTWKQKCAGVHLFLLHGYSHAAFTTRYARGVWLRTYSVVLPYDEDEWDLEFAFFLSALSDYADFCRVAINMDELVGSLEWDVLQEKRRCRP